MLRHRYVPSSKSIAWAAKNILPALMSVMLLTAAPAFVLSQAVGFVPQQVLLGNNLTGLRGVALDGSKNLFFTVPGSNAVEEIPAAGGYIGRPIALGGTGNFKAPADLAVDSDGNVFVADSGNGAVKEILAPVYTTVKTLGGGTGPNFTTPQAVALDANGNIFVADSGANAVIEIPAAGGYDTLKPLAPTGVTFKGPAGIAVDSGGNVFVADTGNSLVKEILAAGGYTTGNTLAATFNSPNGVALDLAGNLFVADTNNSAVKEIAAAGGYTAASTLVSGLGQPVGVAIDRDGNVFVTEQTGNQVLELEPFSVNFGSANVCPTGQTTPAPCTQTLTLTYDVTTSGTLKTPSVLTTGQANLDFTLGSTTCTGAVTAGQTCTVQVKFAPLTPGVRSGAVAVLDNAGKTLVSNSIYGAGIAPAVAYAPAGPITQFGGGLTGPAGVALDAKGNLFVVDNGGSAVKEFAAPGYTTPGVTLGSGFKIPFGVALDGSGNVFVADSGNKAVKEILAAGGYLTVKTVGAGFSNPEGVAVDGSGNVYVADSSDNTVKEILAAGGYATVTNLGAGFNAPSGVAVDSAGNVFVADFGNNGLKEVLASSGYTKVNTLATGLSGPSGVALDAAGNVYVTENVNSTLVKEFLAPDYATVLSLDTSTSSPVGVALDSLGNVFIGSGFSHSIPQLQRSQPPAFTFAITQVGATSTDSPKAVQLQNIGNATLTATGLVISTDFSQSAGSGTPEDCTSTISLAPGAECNLSLNFTPDSFTPPAGATSGTATLTDNALNSTSATQVINLAGTATKTTPDVALNSSVASPSGYGAPITFTATVTNPNGTATGVVSPTGSVSFTDSINAGAPVACTNSGAGVLSASGAGSSTATCQVNVASFATGSHTITATYNPGADPNYLPTSTTLSHTVSPATPTVTVGNAAVASGTTGTSVYGTQVTFVVTVAGPTGATQPSVQGSVTVVDTSVTPNLTLCASVPLTQGTAGSTAQCPYSLLPAGSKAHTIFASYTPGTDPNYNGVPSANSQSFSQTVTPYATTVSLTSAPVSPVYGSASGVTLTAKISGAPAAVLQPSGSATSVNFTDSDAAPGSAPFCTSQNTTFTQGTTAGSGSVAVCTTTAFPGGAHNITATYAADTNYTTASGSAAFTVNPATPTVSIALDTGSTSISSYGMQVTFTASVAGIPGFASPTGKIDFYDANLQICAAVPVGGKCSYQSLSVGTHAQIYAHYNGDGNYSPLQSSPLTPAVVVGKASPTVTVSNSQNETSTYGDAVTFTATVVGIQGVGVAQPSGTVSFFDGGSSLCTTQPLEPSAASGPTTFASSCSTMSLMGGLHSITAQYIPSGADPNYAATTSAAITQTVNRYPPKLAPVVTSPSTSVLTNPVTLTATVAGVNKLASPVGTITFTNNSTPIPGCTNLMTTPGTAGSGASSATCGTTSLTASNNIQAAFTVGSADPNYSSAMTAQGVAQIIQDFNLQVAVNQQAVSTTTAVGVTQGFTSATDPFNTVAITVSSAPINMFSDQLNISCTVSGGSAGATLPTCSTLPVPATPTNPSMFSLSGNNGSLPIAISVGSSATVGTYTVTLSALDPSAPNLPAKTQSFLVNVVQAASASLASIGSSTVTFGVANPIPSTSVLSCGTIYTVNADGTPNLSAPLTTSDIGISCSGFAPASSGVNSYTFTITAGQSGSAQLAKPGNVLMAFLAFPGLLLITLTGRVRRVRRTFLPVLVGSLLLTTALQISGCGSGGFTRNNQVAASTGSYLLEVVSTDANHNTQTVAVVPLTIGH
jgi:sugar lactone lactonase YvrE